MFGACLVVLKHALGAQQLEQLQSSVDEDQNNSTARQEWTPMVKTWWGQTHIFWFNASWDVVPMIPTMRVWFASKHQFDPSWKFFWNSTVPVFGCFTPPVERATVASMLVHALVDDTLQLGCWLQFVIDLVALFLTRDTPLSLLPCMSGHFENQMRVGNLVVSSDAFALLIVSDGFVPA